MDKSLWPQAWKDQYNAEISKRKTAKKARIEKEQLFDKTYFPQISEFKLDEENVFAMLAYRFPLNSIVSKILQKFISNVHMNELILGSRYLNNTQNIFPGHYSDRERIVVMMNRYRMSEDFNELIGWICFQRDKSTFHLIHLLLGVISLDQYIDGSVYKNESLQTAIHHLKIAQNNFYSEDSRGAIAACIAFCHYLNRDFESARRHLNPNKANIENDFIKLLKKVA